MPHSVPVPARKIRPSANAPRAPLWRTLKSVPLVAEPDVRVTRDEARYGDRAAHARPVVDFGVDAAVAAARTSDGRWVLVGCQGYATRRFGWEFPGGPLVRGERPQGAAAFELARCAGMRAWGWRRQGAWDPLPDALPMSCTLMVAQNAEKDPDAPREDPFVPVRLVTDSQMDGLVRSGRVRDAATLAAWAILRSRG